MLPHREIRPACSVLRGTCVRDKRMVAPVVGEIGHALGIPVGQRDVVASERVNSVTGLDVALAALVVRHDVAVVVFWRVLQQRWKN